MHARQKETSALGFRHLSRRLEPGETPPRMPSLMEQVVACRFELSAPEPEPDAAEDFDNDDEWEDDARLDS
jgi:hypothetical protein